MNEAVPVAQLILNLVAVCGGGVVLKLYVANLKASVAAKEATTETAEKNRDFWKDKFHELEKRSPEVVEKSLAERIQIRDAELERYRADKEQNSAALRDTEIKKAALEQDLARTQGFRAMLAMEGDDDQDLTDVASAAPSETVPSPTTITVDLIGEVAVDSGQLMITDPCYVDSEWQEEPYGSGAIAERDHNAAFNYSYDGACRSTTGEEGHGQLAFTRGHTGAGVAFGTAWGDGFYPVYAEKHDGRIVRVYVNVG